MNIHMKSLVAGFFLMCFAGSAMAQDKGTAYKFGERWFISGSVGVNAYVGDYDGQRKFGDRISIGVEGSVGKWLTPVWALRLQGGVYNAQGMNAHSKEGWNYALAHADVMVDAMTLFKGVDEERCYSFIPYVGFGAGLHRRNGKDNTFAFGVGAVNRFRLSEHLDANIELKAVLVNDRFDRQRGGRSGEGAASMTVGFTYNF